MASASKKNKNRARNKNKKHPRKEVHHLPKVGTPADNAYLFDQSRKDVVDFGLTPAKRGAVNAVLIIAIIALLVLALTGLLLFTKA